MIRKLLILLLVPFAVFVQAKDAPKKSAHIGFSPSMFRVSLDSGQADGTINVINLSDKAKRVALDVKPWELAVDSTVLELPSSEDSLDQWMIINPTDFMIESQASRSIRWAIMPRVQLPNGEYRVMIYLTEMGDPEDKRPLQLNYRFGLPVYVTVGDANRIGVLDDIVINVEDKLKPKFGLTISSIGNAHVRIRGSYGLWDKTLWPGEDKALAELSKTDKPSGVFSEAGVSISNLPKRPILQDTTRTIWIQPALPEEVDTPTTGKTVRELIFFLSFTLGEDTFQRVVPFTVSR
jgi:hypothetical protein